MSSEVRRRLAGIYYVVNLRMSDISLNQLGTQQQDGSYMSGRHFAGVPAANVG